MVKRLNYNKGCGAGGGAVEKTRGRVLNVLDFIDEFSFRFRNRNIT